MTLSYYSYTNISLRTTDFTVNCVNCTITGDFNLSAGDNNIPFHIFKISADVEKRASGFYFDFNDIWVAATVDNLNATFKFEIDLKASNTTNNFTVPLYTQTKSLRVRFVFFSFLGCMIYSDRLVISHSRLR